LHWRDFQGRASVAGNCRRHFADALSKIISCFGENRGVLSLGAARGLQVSARLPKCHAPLAFANPPAFAQISRGLKRRAAFVPNIARPQTPRPKKAPSFEGASAFKGLRP